MLLFLCITSLLIEKLHKKIAKLHLSLQKSRLIFLRMGSQTQSSSRKTTGTSRIILSPTELSSIELIIAIWFNRQLPGVDI